MPDAARSVTVKCPSCSEALLFECDWRTTHAQCPKCRHRFALPDAAFNRLKEIREEIKQEECRASENSLKRLQKSIKSSEWNAIDVIRFLAIGNLWIGIVAAAVMLVTSLYQFSKLEVKYAFTSLGIGLAFLLEGVLAWAFLIVLISIAANLIHLRDSTPTASKT